MSESRERWFKFVGWDGKNYSIHGDDLPEALRRGIVRAVFEGELSEIAVKRAKESIERRMSMNNSDEERDESEERLDSDKMDCIALILANTKKDLREVVENQLGWSWTLISGEIVQAVRERLRQCSTCSFWVPVRGSGEPIICVECVEMELRSKRFAMTPVTVTEADLDFLRKIGVSYSEQKNSKER
jgi:hypothetical protein